jgi:hypothetical protein
MGRMGGRGSSPYFGNPAPLSGALPSVAPGARREDSVNYRIAGKVRSITDGDSIALTRKRNVRLVIRLLDMDTPETSNQKFTTRGCKCGPVPFRPGQIPPSAWRSQCWCNGLCDGVVNWPDQAVAAHACSSVTTGQLSPLDDRRLCGTLGTGQVPAQRPTKSASFRLLVERRETARNCGRDGKEIPGSLRWRNAFPKRDGIHTKIFRPLADVQ